MSETKHTPGPWFTDTGFVRAKESAVAITQGNGVVRFPQAEVERVANARLIAAVPDLPHQCNDPACPGGQKWQAQANLLVAAKEAAKVLSYWTHPMAREPHYRLEAAIAKAEER